MALRLPFRVKSGHCTRIVTVSSTSVIFVVRLAHEDTVKQPCVSSGGVADESGGHVDERGYQCCFCLLCRQGHRGPQSRRQNPPIADTIDAWLKPPFKRVGPAAEYSNTGASW